MTLKKQLFLTTIFMLGSAPLPSFAQEEGGIETIIVTAQKRAEDQQKVAISMEAFSNESLEAFQIQDIRRLSTLVPNVYYQQSPGNDAIYIRGFGSTSSNFGFDQTVSLYQDGIYAGRARQLMGSFFDVERIEVLRGPQGALLGKNTAAGAISITTAGPTETLEGKVKAVYNTTREGADTEAYVAGPLSENLGGRLAVKFTNFQGFIRNVASGNDDPKLDNKLARLSFKYEPREDTTVNAKLEYADFVTVGVNAASTTPGAPIPTVRNDSNVFGQPFRDSQTAYNASVTADFGVGGNHTLTSITGFNSLDSFHSVDAENGPNAIFVNQFFEEYSQFSQEIRLLSPTDQRFEYIIGAYYDKSDYDMVAPTYMALAVLGADGILNIDFMQDSTTWSAFAAGTFHVTDELSLSSSIRYTKGDKDGSFAIGLLSGTSHPAISNLPLPRSFSAPVSEDFFDPSVTLEYDVLPDVMLYATYGRGSKQGGYVSSVRTTIASNFTFTGERSTNYEVGVKSSWLDRTLIANLTAFRTEFEDLQVAAYSAAVATNIIRNAASANSQGWEGSLIWQPIDDLQLSSSFAYLETEYDDYAGAACTALQPSPPCVTATNNLAGYPFVWAPKWSGNVKADYTIPIGDDLTMGIILAMNFKSKYYNATDYSPVYGIQEGWEKFDLRVELAEIDDKWSIAIVGTNLTDETTRQFAFFYPGIVGANGNRIVRYFDDPRTISIEGTWRF